jgi:hypothetical protein
VPTTPTPDTAQKLGAIPETHTDPNGHEWHLTVHWADINGRAIPIGLDLHAFTDTDGNQLHPTGGVLNASVLRSLRIGEVIEATRQHGTWTTTKPAAHETTPPRTETPRGPGRRPERDDDFIAEVAALFNHARAQGGEPARKPWRYVTEQLTIRGVQHITEGQLKNWSRRAKNLGLISTKEKE